MADDAGSADNLLLIRSARVYDRALDVHRSAVRDVIVEGNGIASVTAPDELAGRKAEITDATERKSLAPP